jgi:hypothetical protein
MNMSFLGLPPGMLQSYCNLVTKLRETLGSLPSDLVTLIQLAILWRVPQASGLSIREVQPSICQATGLAERYMFHLTEKLDGFKISDHLTQKLISAMPYQSFVPN